MASDSSETKKVVTSFSRIEDKFILPKNLVPEFVKLLSGHLDRSFGSETSEDSDNSGNQSIYFDSKQVDCFQQHFDKVNERFKLRIRRYRNRGVWDSDVIFVECKFKINGTSSKQRFLLTKEAFEQMLDGNEIEITPELFKINTSMKKETLLKRANELNQIFRTLKARPKLIVEYQRWAFERADLRVTIDRHISLQPLGTISKSVVEQIKKGSGWNQAIQMQRVFDNDKHCLIEIKHSGQHPEWFDEFMREHSIGQTSFSKYCWGMSQVMEAIDQDAPFEEGSFVPQTENASSAHSGKDELCSLAV